MSSNAERSGCICDAGTYNKTNGLIACFDCDFASAVMARVKRISESQSVCLQCLGMPCISCIGLGGVPKIASGYSLAFRTGVSFIRRSLRAAMANRPASKARRTAGTVATIMRLRSALNIFLGSSTKTQSVSCALPTPP